MIRHLKEGEKRAIIAGTLSWINAIRRENGLEELECLQPGLRRNSKECPISMSLAGVAEEIRTATYGVVFTNEEENNATLKVPDVARQFIEWFDTKQEFGEFLAAK